MMRRIILGLVMAMAFAPALGQTPVLSGSLAPCGASGTDRCFRPPLAWVPLGFQQLATLTSAVGLTVPAGATAAYVVCTGQPVTWRDDGTAPTATVGIPLPVNTVLLYQGTLGAIQFIQTTATAVCNVAYYK